MALISIRQQIKNKLVNIFTGLTVNSKNINIFLNDPYSLEEDDLPALCIQAVSELIENTTVGYPRSQQRVLNIDLTCIYQSTNNLDEIIDEFCYLIENKLSETEEATKLNTLNGVIIDSKIENIEIKDFSEIATKTSGYTLNLVITYHCIENDLKTDI